METVMYEAIMQGASGRRKELKLPVAISRQQEIERQACKHSKCKLQ